MQVDECFSNTYLEPIRHIASGGMGDIFLAKDTRLNRQVAVKRIRLPTALGQDQNRTQALYEARLMAKANHPNIVQLYDIVEFDSELLLVLEYVEGQTLAKHMRQKLLTLNDKLALLEKITRGIHYLHQQSLVHCDIKPSNILISDSGKVKISDFGIANILHGQNQVHDKLSSYGSTSSMSPEQLEGKQVGYTSDVFSLGVLAFELIFGCHPFGDEKGEQLTKKIRAGLCRDMDSLLPKLPEELVLLLRKMLHRSPVKRPSCKEVINVLIRTITLLEVSNSDDTASLPVNVLEKHNRSQHLSKPLLIGTMLCVLFIIIGYMGKQYFNVDEEVNYTLVLEPKVSAGSGEPNVSNLLLATIDSAVRQTVMRSPNAELIDHGEYINNRDISSLIAITGASTVLVPEVRCEATQCNVRLSCLGTDKRVVLGELGTDVQREDYLAISSIYQTFTAKLLGISGRSNSPKLAADPEFYEEYLALYHDVNFKGNYSRYHLDKTLKLIEQDPNYYALYKIARHLFLELYHAEKKDVYLSDLKALLDNAPAGYKASKPYLVDMIVYSIESGDESLATELFERFSVYGETAESLHLNGYFAYRFHRIEEAINMYSKAMALKPSLKSKYSLAVVYYDHGQFELAQSLLDEIVTAFPWYIDGRALSADLSMLRGNFNAAISNYLVVVEHHENAVDYNNLSLAYMLSSQYPEALEAAFKAKNLAPKNSSIRLNYADLLFLSSQYQLAQDEYKSIINAFRDSTDYIDTLNLGQAFAHLNQHQKALEKLHRAVKLTTDKLQYYYAATLIFTLSGESKSGLINFNAAIDGGYSPVWFNLPWFQPLCKHPTFNTLNLSLDKPICKF
ncbi:serine/threonine-protein kinase [Pseudoalteromonas luteoviolacea]|uniref:serine/threonine-protein kinase n=1 Tax=Pseudoalteromonas luteoviolacea TaxID=43657 RepID=UPI0011532EAB|nr:serine/threonine-protein kinase [Pseudoalteromonas luteoviolacea]TQF71477.1 protein kinase [Pseudoalteromonas luteoviolacea]